MIRFLIGALFFSLTVPAFAQDVSPGQATLIQLANDIRQETVRKNGKIPPRPARAIEALFYHSQWIGKAIDLSLDYTVPTTGSALRYVAAEHLLRYDEDGIHLQRDSAAPRSATDAELRRLEDELFDQVLGSRGYQSQYLTDDHPATDDPADQWLTGYGPKTLRMSIAEKWADDGRFEGSKWQYLPVRLVAWPVQKVLYDLPAMVTSTVTESVSRSPIQNLLGTGDEARSAGKLLINGFKDMGLGIAHPQSARFFDGTLELLDLSVKLGSIATGAVKTAVSVVAYPIYRLLGGRPNQRVALPGKRAVLVLIDTGSQMAVANGIVDTYGEMIVRSKLKGLADYYCVRTNAEPNDMKACIDEIPAGIQYLDIISLQHRGGIEIVETLARYAQGRRGLRPELLLSIGCRDAATLLTQGENALGQQKVSWAVHYYLANLIEKRLRGIPAQQAANQAFGEGFVTNAIDPISWGAVVTIGTRPGEKLKNGYLGSQPRLITNDSLVEANIEKFLPNRVNKVNRPKAGEFFTKVRLLLTQKKITLKRKTLRQFESAEQAFTE